MAAKISNVTEEHQLDIGEDRTIRIRVTDETTGAPVADGVMAGWSLEWTLREEATDNEIIITKAKAAGQIIISHVMDPLPVNKGGTGANIDVVDVFLIRADTLNIRPGRYYHTLKRTNAGNNWDISKGSVALQMSAAR